MAGRRSRKLLLPMPLHHSWPCSGTMAWTRSVASDGGISGQAGWQRYVDNPQPALLKTSRS